MIIYLNDNNNTSRVSRLRAGALQDLVPRLYPFLYHVSCSVRQSALTSLAALVQPARATDAPKSPCIVTCDSNNSCVVTSTACSKSVPEDESHNIKPVSSNISETIDCSNVQSRSSNCSGKSTVEVPTHSQIVPKDALPSCHSTFDSSNINISDNYSSSRDKVQLQQSCESFMLPVIKEDSQEKSTACISNSGEDASIVNVSNRIGSLQCTYSSDDLNKSKSKDQLSQDNNTIDDETSKIFIKNEKLLINGRDTTNLSIADFKLKDKAKNSPTGVISPIAVASAPCTECQEFRGWCEPLLPYLLRHLLQRSLIETDHNNQTAINKVSNAL